MCKTLRICCLLVKQVISKIIDSTCQERMKYLFKGQKNWIHCRMKAVFTAKVLGWICSPLTHSAYPRAWLGIGLKFTRHAHIAHDEIVKQSRCSNVIWSIRGCIIRLEMCFHLFDHPAGSGFMPVSAFKQVPQTVWIFHENTFNKSFA